MDPQPHRRRRRSIAKISAVCVLALARVALAQSAEAEAMFSDGERLMKDGKLDEACQAFEESNKLESRAGTLIMLGECREKNHQIASAWSAYKDALRRVKDPRKRVLAEQKVAELEPRLSYLTVSVSDESRVPELALTRNGTALDAALWNRALPVNGGDYVIAGRAPGHESWSTTVTVPVEGGKISVEVPRFKDLTKLQGTIPPPRVVAHAPPPDRGPSLSPWSPKRRIAVALGVGGAVALGVGIAVGAIAQSKQHDASALCPDPAMPCASAASASQLNSQAHGLAIGADATFAIAAAAAAGAGVLWFTGKPERAPRAAIAPAISPRGAGLALEGTW